MCATQDGVAGPRGREADRSDAVGQPTDRERSRWSRGMRRSIAHRVCVPASALGRTEPNANFSASGAGVADTLAELSSTYGVVILAPADIMARTATVGLANGLSAEEAMKSVAEQAGLELRSLGSSIFAVK